MNKANSDQFFIPNKLHLYPNARNGKEQGAERVILWVKKKKEELFNNMGEKSLMLMEVKKVIDKIEKVDFQIILAK